MDADMLQAIVDRYARGTLSDDDVRALIEDAIALREQIAQLRWRLAS